LNFDRSAFTTKRGDRQTVKEYSGKDIVKQPEPQNFYYQMLWWHTRQHNEHKNTMLREISLTESNKKLSCRRSTDRVMLRVIEYCAIGHVWSLKVIRNDTLEKGAILYFVVSVSSTIER